jgi:hypothetical protein
LAREITWIVSDGGGPSESIDCVGGAGWTKSEDTVIAEIEAGCDYFVEVDGGLVSVVVAERGGRRCLRTDFEQTPVDRLRALPTRP